MARMHSRKKGKSKSHRPINRDVPDWVSYKPKEVEALISKLAKKGQTASQIGLHLRDEYGVPDVKALLGKSVTTVLEEKDILPDIPDDLMALLTKEVKLRKHLENNAQPNEDSFSPKAKANASSGTTKRLASSHKTGVTVLNA